MRGRPKYKSTQQSIEHRLNAYHMAGLDCGFDLSGVKVQFRIGGVSSTMMNDPFDTESNDQIWTSNERI